jgi:hypothetical protein
VILFYTKGEEWTWNPVYTPYDQEYVQSNYKHIEPATGRRYQLDNITGPGGAAKGNPSYEVMGVTRYWRYSKQKMDELIQQGRIVQTKPGAVPCYKRYLDEMLGVPLQDVWTDIGPISSQAAERLGYPTQKPEALLERIINTSSDSAKAGRSPWATAHLLPLTDGSSAVAWFRPPKKRCCSTGSELAAVRPRLFLRCLVRHTGFENPLTCPQFREQHTSA